MDNRSTLKPLLIKSKAMGQPRVKHPRRHQGPIIPRQLHRPSNHRSPARQYQQPYRHSNNPLAHPGDLNRGKHHAAIF